MRIYKAALVTFIFLVSSGCETLEKKTILINAGDTKKSVLELMGPPQDRQMQQKQEAWQYCAFLTSGYSDHKIIWFNEDFVTGITSYKIHSASCELHFKTIKWEEAPNLIIEKRER